MQKLIEKTLSTNPRSKSEEQQADDNKVTSGQNKDALKTIHNEITKSVKNIF